MDWPEDLEDVVLDEEIQAPVSKRKGLFSRLVDSTTQDRFLFGARRRGQSLQGSELENIDTKEEEVEVVPRILSPIRASVN
jgi:hypothetical protein